MAQAQTPPRGNTPSVISMKRPLEDDHTPNISSPLNPDAATKAKPPPRGGREPREKKESLKKREASGHVKQESPDYTSKKRKIDDTKPVAPSPVRYNHPLPRETFQYTVKDPVFASRESEPLVAPNGTELKKPVDHTENRKAYRYDNCAADPLFKHSRYFRQSDSKPYGSRMSFEDSDKRFYFSESGTVVTNEKGWRMGRANVAAREGNYYYEVKILRGVPPEGSPVQSDPSTHQGPLPHIRMGWARREAPLDAPVGFDGYSYGLTDIRMEPMHKSRASKFLDDGSEASVKKASKKSSKNKTVAAAQAFAANDHVREGDVIGIEIVLPSLTLHRKIVEGIYNPAVDVGPSLDTAGAALDDDGAPNIVRDRFPVPYKGTMYFESMEYRASKGMEGYGDRGPFAKETPSPNHTDPTLRNLPHSCIRVYKNGRRIGTAFRDLMAFLPPASAPGQEKGVRQGCDDGMLGYFPAISAFSGGIAQVNFGPDFWFPLPQSQGPAAAAMTGGGRSASTEAGAIKKEENDVAMAGTTDSELTFEPGGGPKPVGIRYTEQIVEDVVYDLIDEVDFFMQDDGQITLG